MGSKYRQNTEEKKGRWGKGNRKKKWGRQKGEKGNDQIQCRNVFLS